MSKFVHLHTHSHYSLLEALPKIPDLVKKAGLSNMDTLALTDSGNLYGAIEFYKECLGQGIKPIIGVDFYVANRTRSDKENRIDNVNSRLILLSENLVGYKNLLKLVTYSYLEGFYYKPRIDRELLEKYHAGLIAISREPKYYQEIFGDRLYRSVTPDDLAVKPPSGIPIVATYDVHYLEAGDRPIFDTIRSIQERHDRSRTFNDDSDLSFRTLLQAQKDFKNFPEALENTVKIAKLCNLELELGKWVFPHFKVPGGKSFNDKLREEVEAGLSRRGLKETKEIRERIERELEVICGKGFAPYFLIVSDLYKWAKSNGVTCGPGRGSAAGCLISYLTDITNINPLEYNLPFERFMNPDRPSPPDIDMDFDDINRDRVIEYVKNKYGADHVAQIGTFGTMLARGAVRDITRALGFAYELGDKIAKLIPFGTQGFPMTIDRVMKENPDLKKLYEEDKDTKTILDTAKKIEGNARHISVHAAGVVISPEPMIEYVPLQFDPKGRDIVTQYDMYSLDPNAGGDMVVGLLKFDFLGLRNLSIIADTIERIKKIEGKEIDIEQIPLDDKKTFEMLAEGETEGTFQLNGNAMTRFLINLKPTSIHDINAMVALFRPGPMQFIPLFIERKHNPRLIKYLDPALKPILEKTYGVLVYQDDLLMIARNIAGYSWLEVDKFRKAVGKKIPEEMRAQKEKFIKGVMSHSQWPQRKAEELWTWIEPFAAYGFNKAHSVSYGRVAYQTAYLKANFPAIYMSAVLTAESGDVETIGIMVNECKRMGIDVLPPSINESFSQFSVIPPVPYKIRFGLTTIKNFGQDISSTITAERKANGKFKDLADFLSRITSKNLNKKSLEALIKCGALDEFDERGKLLANLDRLLDYHRERVNAPKNQDTLFGLMSDSTTIPTLRLAESAAPASPKERLAWEKELLGLYISSHPLEPYREKISALKVTVEKLSGLRENTETVIAGLVEQARDVLTKGNERMVFMRLSDFSGSIEVAVFPKVLSKFRALVQPDACIAIKGRVSKRRGETSFIAEKIKAL